MSCEKVVTAAIIRRSGSVLLARRSSGEKLAGFWEFPGGKVEDGETPEGCLARELHEELGIRVLIGRRFAESLHEYDHGNFRIIAYFADWIAGDLTGRVHDRLEWVKNCRYRRLSAPPADVPIAALLLNSELT